MYMLNMSKTDIQWLAKGLDKKDFREYCTQILVKDGYAYATNGHVIHKIKTAHDELDGLYTKDGIKLDVDYKHPLLNRELVDKGYDLAVVLTVNPNNLLELRTSIPHKGVNKTYFNNAVDRAKEITLHTNEDQASIRIDYESRTAIIMCTNMSKE